jgi:hypothetical protein
MKTKLIGAQLTSIALSLLFASSAWADVDSNHSSSGVTSPALLTLIGSDDLFSTTDLATVFDPTGMSGSGGTQHYGPFTSTSPDSGTCGNDWATDTFDRHFTVKTNADGTFTVVEQFKNGSFVTMAGFSPGGCQNGAPAGMVNGGITGSLHGYFIIPLPLGISQMSTSPYCDAAGTNANCTTATFINTHFKPACYPTACPVTTFFFHYAASDQGLIQHEWKNASADRGGNSGDIRSTNIP